MTIIMEFYRLGPANEARKIAENWLSKYDDRRLTEVWINESIPDDVQDLLEWREYRATPDRRFGQSPLTEYERRRIDFTETNTFHARSAKAIAQAMEVSNWISYYDKQLTVDEHYDIYERAREDVPRSKIPKYMRGRA